MIKEKEEFIQFLQELKLSDIDTIISRFEKYYQLLIEYNQHINLFSRATPLSNLWTHHFLDSLLPLKVIDFSNKKIMDFGRVVVYQEFQLNWRFLLARWCS